MRLNSIPIILALFASSCNFSTNAPETNSNSGDDINNSLADVYSDDTSYDFDRDISLPPTYYFDTLYLHDTATNAHYISYCVQSTQPDMEDFNLAIKTALEEKVLYEKSFVDSSFNYHIDFQRFDYELALIKFYSNERVLSISYVKDDYTSGAAHHNHSWYTFNFDLKTNQIIRFEDVIILENHDDSIAFITFAEQHVMEGGCHDNWGFAYKYLDFSFGDKGIYFKPYLGWSCGSTRSYLPAFELGYFLKKEWIGRF